MRHDPAGPGAAPLDPTHAVRELEAAGDREQIFELVLRAARARTRFAALIAVHADQLRGRRVIAEAGVDAGAATALQLPRGAVPALEAVIAARAPAIATLATGEPFVDGLLDQLGGQLGGPTPAALILPIALGARTAALVVAHCGAEPPPAAAIAELVPVTAAASAALGRVLAARRRAATDADAAPPRPPPPPRAATVGYEIEVSFGDGAPQDEPAAPAPSVAELRAALAELRRREAWAELAGALRELILAGTERGEPDEPDEDEQLELLLELGQIEEGRLGRPARAIEAWQAALAIDPADARVLDALEAALVGRARWAEAAELLERRAALAEGPRPRAEALLRLAVIAREQLGDDERAVAAYERVLTREPGHPVAGAALEALYAARGQWQPLATLLVDRAGRQAGTEALAAAARIYEEELGDPRAAIVIWLAAIRREAELALAPERLDQLDLGGRGSLDRIDRLVRASEAWAELIGEAAELADELGPAHPEAAARLWLRVGRWRRDLAADRPGAAAALERALGANPDELDALTELIELLREGGRWAELAELLERRAQATADAARRAELYAELGALYEGELGRPAEAIASYERALASAPDPAPALVELHRLYLQAGAWEALAELVPRLTAQLAATAPPAVIAELHAELGGILADHLARPDDAARAFRDALALDPRAAAARAGLARIYESAGQADALLDATEAEVDAAPRAEQLRRYADVASGWLELGRADRAAACWQKLLALDPRAPAALRGLARALRAQERWPELVGTLRVLRELPGEPAARCEALLELGAVLEDRFDDLAGAAAAYQEVTAAAPDHRGALHALARLHDRAGRLQPALAALTRLLELTPADFPARADLLARIGHVQLAARDAAAARVAFAQAIALDRESSAAHEGLARVHVLAGELVAAGDELERAARLAADPADALRCLADAAWLYRHRLGDAERARDCLHRVLERDPANADARRALAELLAETRRWEDLWPHLEQEVARAVADPALPPAERWGIYERAARCAVELGRFPLAHELYDRAREIDPRPALLLDRADALHRAQDLAGAAAAYQAIAAEHAAALDRGQLLGLYRRLAQLHAALGRPAQAQAMHRKVLDLDPRHAETLEDLAELELQRGRPDEAVAALRELAAARPPAERIAVLERIGDLYRDRLANPARAASTYLEALELDATNRRALQRLLDLQTGTGQWRAATETIDRFLAHEADPARRASYLLASAEIRRAELRDRPGALACYEAALDELLAVTPPHPRALEVLGALRELYAADRSWKQLEQAYRRVIKRLPPEDPALIALWDQLGELYRAGLELPQSAIEALELAHARDPDRSPERARRLAELYAQTGARRAAPGAAAAPAAHAAPAAARLVELDPASPEAHRAVAQTALAAGQLDAAWCACRALVVQKQATAEEAALYRRYQAHEVRKATGILDDDAWDYVRHPDEDRALSAIFALVWEAAVALRAGPPKTFELKAKERMPIEGGSGVIAKIFRHAARVLHVPLPEVYVQPRRSGRLLLANCLEKGRLSPTVIVGRDLMTGYRDTELAAVVGALLAQLRPAYYVKLALPGPGELEAALAAAARLAGHELPAPDPDPLGGALLPALRERVARPAVDALRALLDRLPRPPDLARWRAAVDACAQRAGLLVSGELAATARMMSTEAALVVSGRPAQRTAELVGYSVSPAYLAARRHLGVAVA